MPKFLIEGMWTGYTTAPRRIVHLSVHIGNDLRYWVSNTPSIEFTDGTFLLLRCYDLEDDDEIEELPSYRSLIMECFHKKVTRVADLIKR